MPPCPAAGSCPAAPTATGVRPQDRRARTRAAPAEKARPAGIAGSTPSRGRPSTGSQGRIPGLAPCGLPRAAQLDPPLLVGLELRSGLLEVPFVSGDAHGQCRLFARDLLQVRAQLGRLLLALLDRLHARNRRGEPFPEDVEVAIARGIDF